MLATLLRKNKAKSSVDNFVVDCCNGGCSNLSTALHKARGLRSQASTVVCQKVVNFDS